MRLWYEVRVVGSEGRAAYEGNYYCWLLSSFERVRETCSQQKSGVSLYDERRNAEVVQSDLRRFIGMKVE